MIEVRKAIEEELFKLWEIQIKAFEEDSKINKDFSPGDQTYKEFEEWIKSYEAYTVIYNKVIVGGVFVREYNQKEVWKISRIFIKPSCQSSGIGTYVIREIESKYKDIAKVWILETPEKNLRSQKFYEQNGFFNIGITSATDKLKTINYRKNLT
ncbi:GNAT family N-acetyltransferase [Halanaerobium congolense]|jgi:N-acetylglutamate synthase-like GNAT family acetyltransferase|uniref:GNAT family N-acetyltransferase n=1 Tax=Halanaerobium congolense TaxID=54121 RepID=UPI001061A593|nr:GNAT family N-acetyltransferase [Halanaerobium congolense]TDP26853.1 ribosomal protein S18 acetylase RimI-like enzyme [Halanaerobium congolense]